MANGNDVTNNTNANAAPGADDSQDNSNSFIQVLDNNGQPVSDPVAEARKRFPDQLKDKTDAEIYSNFADPGAKNSYQKLRAAFPDETSDMSPDQLSKWMGRVAEVRPDYNPPGFFARTSEAVLGTEHPFSDTAARLKQLVTNPSQFASDAATGVENYAAGLNTLGKNLVQHPIDTIEAAAPGGAEFKKDLANKNYRGAAGDIVGGVAADAAMALGGRAPAPLSTEEASRLALRGGMAPVEGAESAAKLANPTVSAATTTVAGREVPITQGQASTAADAEGNGQFTQGIEELSAGMPGGRPLKQIASAQQSAARDTLADLAAKTGAGNELASSDPQAIESNWTKTIANTRTKAQNLYGQVAQADEAENPPDLLTVRATAAALLDDDDFSQVLTGKARSALNALAGKGSDDADLVSSQIFGQGKTYSTLTAEQQAEVQKALGYTPESNIRGALSARSQLLKAAESASDPAAKRLLNHAVAMIDDSIDVALETFDEENGTNLKGVRQQANGLWSQQSAMQKFRNGLQKIMRKEPQSGMRSINGEAFEALVNSLDPVGGGESRTALSRMFANDPQSVADLHALADFMKRHQARAGSFGATMARMRVMGADGGSNALRVIAFLSNAAGLSYFLSRPGMARTLLDAMKALSTTAGPAGVTRARAVAAAGQLIRAANVAQQSMGLRTTGAVPLISDAADSAQAGRSVPSMISKAANSHSSSSSLPLMIKGAVAAHHAKQDGTPYPLHMNPATGSFAHYDPQRHMWVNSVTKEPIQ